MRGGGQGLCRVPAGSLSPCREGCSELLSGPHKDDHSLTAVGTGKSNSTGMSIASFPGARPQGICLLWDLKEGAE